MVQIQNMLTAHCNLCSFLKEVLKLVWFWRGPIVDYCRYFIVGLLLTAVDCAEKLHYFCAKVDIMSSSDQKSLV